MYQEKEIGADHDEADLGMTRSKSQKRHPHKGGKRPSALQERAKPFKHLQILKVHRESEGIRCKA